MNAPMRLGAEVTAASAGSTLGKLTGGLSLVYASLAGVYVVVWQPVLFALTLGSTVALAGLWHAQRKISFGSRAVAAAHAIIGALVITNVTVEYGVSGDPLHAIPFLFTQLAVGFFAPTAALLTVFFAGNVAAWLATSLALSMTERLGDGVVGLATTTGIGALIFFSRLRNNGEMELLRRAVVDARDRDLREIIDKNPDAVILLRDDRVAYATSTAAEALTSEGTGLIDRELTDFVEDGSDWLDELTDADRGESMIAPLRTDDGTRVFFDFARPVAIDFEHGCATMLAARDVTESQQALNARLLLADRMSVAGTLAAGVAHEINNPLTYVSMNLSVLESMIDTTGEAGELVDEIKHGIQRGLDDRPGPRRSQPNYRHSRGRDRSAQRVAERGQGRQQPDSPRRHARFRSRAGPRGVDQRRQAGPGLSQRLAQRGRRDPRGRGRRLDPDQGMVGPGATCASRSATTARG